MAKVDEYVRSSAEEVKAIIEPSGTSSSASQNSSPPSKLIAEGGVYPVSLGSEGYNTPISYLIKEYIPAGSFGVIYGASGSYKSFFAISLACHVAAGSGWNRTKVRQGLVFFIAGEGGIGVPRRIKAWEDECNHGEQLKNLFIINQPVYLVDNDSVQRLLNTIGFIAEKAGNAPSLIVVDTLARCFAGADENSTKDMNTFIAGCDRIKTETNATVLVIHHTGKDVEKGARGSSALRAASDFEFAVKRSDEGEAFILSCTKSKDDREPEAQLFNLKTRHIFVDQEGDQISSLISSSIGIPLPQEYDNPPKGKNISPNHTAVWQCVRSRTAKQEEATRALIRDDLVAMGMDAGKVRKKLGSWIKKLIDDGCIEERDGSLYPVSIPNEIDE